MRRALVILLSILVSAGLLPSVSSGTVVNAPQSPAKKCVKAKRKGKKDKGKTKPRKRRCKKEAGVIDGYHPRATLETRGGYGADVDLHVFDEFGNHSSPANPTGIEGARQNPEGQPVVGTDSVVDMFFERPPLTTRILYFYACLDSPTPEPIRVITTIADGEFATRHIPHFFLTTDGQEFAFGRTPPSTPDPAFPIPVLCP